MNLNFIFYITFYLGLINIRFKIVPPKDIETNMAERNSIHLCTLTDSDITLHFPTNWLSQSFSNIAVLSSFRPFAFSLPSAWNTLHEALYSH